MVELDQHTTSVFSHVEALPIDLVTQRNTARLIDENLKAQRGLAETPRRIEYKPLVLTGPSGAGKGTLIKWLNEKFPNWFGFSVSYTTRAPRDGEKNGVDYNFVSKKQFEKMIEDGEFIEHCQVHDKMYGTGKAAIREIQSAKKIPLLDIDVQGAILFSKAFPDSNFVAVLPPSVEQLRVRLVKRGTETEKSLKTRIDNAPGEIETLMSRRDIMGYRIVNGDIKTSLCTFEHLISGFYAEEIFNKDTAELIISTPRLQEPESKGFGLMTKVAAIAAAGIMSGAAFLIMRSKQQRGE